MYRDAFGIQGEKGSSLHSDYKVVISVLRRLEYTKTLCDAQKKKVQFQSQFRLETFSVETFYVSAENSIF